MQTNEAYQRAIKKLENLINEVQRKINVHSIDRFIAISIIFMLSNN